MSLKANDRGELNRLNSLEEKCSNCNHKNELTINQIVATKSPYLKYIFAYALLLDIIIGIFLYLFTDFEITIMHTRRTFYVLSLIFVIPFVVASILLKNEMKSIKLFNKYFV